MASTIDEMDTAKLEAFISDFHGILTSGEGLDEDTPHLHDLGEALVPLHTFLSDATSGLRKKHPLEVFERSQPHIAPGSVLEELDVEVVGVLQRHFVNALVDHLGTFASLLRLDRSVAPCRTVLAYARIVLDLSAHVHYLLDVKTGCEVLRCRAVNVALSDFEDRRKDFEQELSRLNLFQGSSVTLQIKEEIEECKAEIALINVDIDSLKLKSLAAGMAQSRRDEKGGRVRFLPEQSVADPFSVRTCITTLEDGGSQAFRNLSGSVHGSERPHTAFAMGLNGWTSERVSEVFTLHQLGDVIVALSMAVSTLLVRLSIDVSVFMPTNDALFEILRRGLNKQWMERIYDRLAE